RIVTIVDLRKTTVAQEIGLAVNPRRICGREQFVGGDETAVLTRSDVHPQVTGRTTYHETLERFQSKYAIRVCVFQSVMAAPALGRARPRAIIIDTLIVTVRSVEVESQIVGRQMRHSPLRLDLLIITRRDLGRPTGCQLA